MPKIIKPNHDLIDLGENTAIESFMIPTMRFLHAKERGNQDDIMFLGPDALGDTVCMLPSIVYALTMPGMRVSVATKWTELFEHLPLANLVDLKVLPIPDEEEFYCIKAYPWQDELAHDFTTSVGTQLVDYISNNLLRQQLPVKHKNISIKAQVSGYEPADVVIHPGASWPSKTFPADWWDAVIEEFGHRGFQPYIVGRSGIVDKSGQAKGTVDIDPRGCLDLRDKLTTLQLADVLQRATVVISNDSAPIHIAASGQAWIGMLATVLRPDNITHWRRVDDGLHPPENIWGWRTKDLALGGIYSDNPLQPNCRDYVCDMVSADRLEKWLPDPKTVADWGLSKLFSKRSF